MAHLILLMLATVVPIQTLKFNNPILSDKRYYEAGALKINGTYYVVASVLNDITDGILPIHTSTDLIDWKSAGYVFDVNKAPAWVNNSYWSPRIHQIGPNFLVYFGAYATAPGGEFRDSGVAIASNPLGPYVSIDRPIISLPNANSLDPSIIYDEGKQYLVWSNGSASINARLLNENGLIFASEQISTLLEETLAWERSFRYPWHIKRGGYHYLLYNAGCSVGVARSTHALGPYEKLRDPILVPNLVYTCWEDVSVTKDFEDENYVIFIIANSKEVVLGSLRWDAENWPYVEEI